MYVIRTFIEFKALMQKNVLKEAYIESFKNYIESEFPKIGDFTQIYGFIDYVKKTIKVDDKLYERQVK